MTCARADLGRAGRPAGPTPWCVPGRVRLRDRQDATVTLKLDAGGARAGERRVRRDRADRDRHLRVGIAVDHVNLDYVAGAAPSAVTTGRSGRTLLFVEGQGALWTPAYSGVTLCTAACDILVLCHRAKPDPANDNRGADPAARRAGAHVRNGVLRPARVAAIALNAPTSTPTPRRRPSPHRRGDRHRHGRPGQERLRAPSRRRPRRVLMDVRVARTATLVVDRMRVEAGQAVVVQGPARRTWSWPPPRELRRVAFPTLQLTSPRAERAALEAAEPAALAAEDRLTRTVYASADALFRIDGGDALDGLDAARAAAPDRRSRARARRADQRGPRPARRAGRWRCIRIRRRRPGRTRGARVRDLVYAAARCDAERPSARGRASPSAEPPRRAARRGGRELRFEAPGTDLRLRIDGQQWQLVDGAAEPAGRRGLHRPHEEAPRRARRHVPTGAQRGPRRRRGHPPRVPRGGGRRGVPRQARAGGAGHHARAQHRGAPARRGRDPHELPRSAVLRPPAARGGGSAVSSLALGGSYPRPAVATPRTCTGIIYDLRQGGEITLDGETVQRDVASSAFDAGLVEA